MIENFRHFEVGPDPFGRTWHVDFRWLQTGMMRHIREVDPAHTVIMMQVENEAGLLGDSRDRSPLAEAAWAKPVPADLMGYFKEHKNTLLPEMQKVWGRNGYKTAGTWGEVFGTDEWADEIFMAYFVGRFMNEVAKAGKAELNIPMYVNAWLGPQAGQELPGKWPSGGPVARVMDVYHAVATSIDLLAPDIYVPDFKGTCMLYTRSGNPLFIPEARDQVGNLFWAVGHDAALGWSPFGVEDLNPQGQVAQAYKALSELPELTKWVAEGKVTAVLVTDPEHADPVKLGGYQINLRAPRPGFGPPSPANKSTGELPGGISLFSRSMPDDTRPFAMVVNTGPDEFLFIGANGEPTFALDSSSGAQVVVSARDEGRYERGKWIPGRRLNGDENYISGLPGPNISMLKVQVIRY